MTTATAKLKQEIATSDAPACKVHGINECGFISRVIAKLETAGLTLETKFEIPGSVTETLDGFGKYRLRESKTTNDAYDDDARRALRFSRVAFVEVER